MPRLLLLQDAGPLSPIDSLPEGMSPSVHLQQDDTAKPVYNIFASCLAAGLVTLPTVFVNLGAVIGIAILSVLCVASYFASLVLIRYCRNPLIRSPLSLPTPFCLPASMHRSNLPCPFFSVSLISSSWPIFPHIFAGMHRRHCTHPMELRPCCTWVRDYRLLLGPRR